MLATFVRVPMFFANNPRSTFHEFFKSDFLRKEFRKGRAAVMGLELKPGTFCAFGDRIVQIDGPDSLSKMTVRDMSTGEIISVDIAKLRPMPTSIKRQDPAFVKADEWKRCTAIAGDLSPFTDEKCVSRADLERIAKRHCLSIRQIQRLRKKFLAVPRTSALVRNSGGRPIGYSGLTPEVHSFVNSIIQKHYFRRERPTKTDIVERVRSVCRRVGLPSPSPNAVLRRIDAQLSYEGDVRRLGAKAAKQKWEPRPGKLAAPAPLDIVEIDHTRVDVMVLSDDRQTVLGRPWISLAIDVCSRVVLGMYLSMHAPSSVSVSLCIEHSVLPKPDEGGSPETWPMYGKPRCILVDNGKDLRSEALKRGCEEHGIELRWRPVRTPHYGAHIERLNGTLMKLCHLLPGTTFSNPKDKGDYDSEARAIMTLPELRDWLVEKICRYYHVRRHRQLGIPPRVAWERALTNEQGKVCPPPMVARPTEFRIDFLPYVFRKVSRTGIEFVSRYWHEDLLPMLGKEDKVMVRYDPRDDHCIWVPRPNAAPIEVPAIAGPAVGQPRRRIALDDETQDQMDQAIDQHFERCDEIERTAARSTRQARKKGIAISKRLAVSDQPAIPDKVILSSATPMSEEAAAPEDVNSGDRVAPVDTPVDVPSAQVLVTPALPASVDPVPSPETASGHKPARPLLRNRISSPLSVDEWA